MKTIREIKAYYPQFVIGGEPTAVECSLRDVEANGKRYTATPFAMLDSFGDDDIERLIGRGFYATKEDCEAYLTAEYPNWKAAAAIGDALCIATANRGKMMGEDMIERITGLNALTQELYKAARGHRSITLKTIRAAVRALENRKQPA